MAPWEGGGVLTCKHIVGGKLNSKGESVGGHQNPGAVVAAIAKYLFM